MSASVEERFWAKVQKTETCWLWTASTRKGYGQFRLTPQTRVSAHRFAYELLVGPVPTGLTLDHLRDHCRSKACVKVVADDAGPAHLEPVTSRENTLRGDGPAARHARQETCIRDHPLTPENIYRPPSRPHVRQCRRCATDRLAERYRRDKQRASQTAASAHGAYGYPSLVRPCSVVR
jgi:hypothetical protein